MRSPYRDICVTAFEISTYAPTSMPAMPKPDHQDLFRLNITLQLSQYVLRRSRLTLIIIGQDYFYQEDGSILPRFSHDGFQPFDHSTCISVRSL